VLPYYFLYIYLYIALSFVAGIFDFAMKGAPHEVIAFNWVVPLEQGLFHWLYEGLAFFLMRYGAGVKAIQRSLMYSFLWGVATFIFYFYIYSISDNSYGQKLNKQKAFALFLTYQAILFAFYALFLIVPSRYLYRRPALEFYAKFNCVLYATMLIVGSLVDAEITDAVCPGAVFIFVEVAFLQPLALFRTFQIDSQYWQGLNPGKGNPLADVWDHVDVRTAETMAERLEHFNTVDRLPVVHFGLLDFDTNNQFVAGGFSRVYFGKYHGEKVAFKILFAMELTPDDVTDFYAEASLLSSLKHENVVGCKGICVMPPALTMVLEHCMYGSLYDFLYKPVKQLHSGSESTRRSLSRIGSRLLNMFSEGGGSSQGRPSTGNNSSNKDKDKEKDKDRESATLNPLRSSVRETPLTSASFSTSQPSLAPGTVVLMDEEKQPSVSEIGPLDISRASVAASHNSLSRKPAPAGTELEQLPRASNRLSAFNVSEAQYEEHEAPARQSFLQRTVETLANMFQGNPSLSGRPSEKDGETMGVPVAHTVSFQTRLEMMRDAVSGIAFMHSRGYMHCDIKSLNFLVDEVSQPHPG
jgi:hypothetical protein